MPPGATDKEIAQVGRAERDCCAAGFQPALGPLRVKIARSMMSGLCRFRRTAANVERGQEERSGSDYSITSSALTCKASGTVSPSVLAVLRLITGLVAGYSDISIRGIQEPQAEHEKGALNGEGTGAKWASERRPTD